jgi:hypothetical protein
MNFSMSLTHADNRLDVTNSNRDSTDNIGFASDVCIELRYFFFVYFVEFWLNISLGINNVLFKHFLIDLEIGVSLLDCTFV